MREKAILAIRHRLDEAGPESDRSEMLAFPRKTGCKTHFTNFVNSHDELCVKCEKHVEYSTLYQNLQCMLPVVVHDTVTGVFSTIHCKQRCHEEEIDDVWAITHILRHMNGVNEIICGYAVILKPTDTIEMLAIEYDLVHVN